MVRRQFLRQVPIGIAVAVVVLEGGGHRLQDGLGGTVGILVVGELRGRVVLFEPQPRPRLPEEGP